MSRRIIVRLFSITTSLGLAALAATACSGAQGAVLTWNASGSNTGPTDGSGTWSLTAGAWWTGSANTIWSNANFDTAVFGAANGTAGAVTISGSVAAGGVTFNPPGSGNYTLGGGTLVLGGASPAITVNSSAEIDSVISGTGGFTVNGPGTLTVTATNNAYSGGTNIASGVLAATGSASLGSGPVTVGPNGTLSLIVSGSQQQPILTNDIAGSGTINAIVTTSNQPFYSGNWSNFAGTLNIPGSGAGIQISGSNNTGSPQMAVNVNGFLTLYQNESNFTRTYNIGSLSGTGSVNGGTPGNPFAITLSVGALGTSTTYGGALLNSNNNQGYGTLGLTKVGSGMLTLTGDNLFTGGVTISGGSLQIGSGGTSGSIYGTPITDNGTLIFNRSDPLYAMGNVITGSGGLVKMGSGQLTLNSASSYTGPTVVSAGTLAISGGLAGFGNSGTGWQVNSSGISSTPITNNVLLLTDDQTNETRSAFYGVPVSTSAFYASFTYRVQQTRNGYGVAFVLQDSSAGTAALGSGGSGLGYGSMSPSVGLLLDLWTSSNTNANATNLTTDGATGTYFSTMGVSLTSSRPIQVALSYDGSSTFTETLTDPSTLATFSKTYTGINLAQVLGGSTAYLGFTGATGSPNSFSMQTISNFVFVSAAGGVNNILPATTPLSIASGASVDMTGATQTIASLADTVPGTGGSQLLLGNGSLTVGDSTTTTFSGTISGSGGSLNKVGAGGLTLAGPNTYTGLTTINQGKLVVNGSLASPVTVNSGGVLAGTGSATSVTVNAGGILAPGDAPGALTLSGNLTLMSSAILDFALGTMADSDEIFMPSGVLNLNGQQFSDFDFTPVGGFGDGVYTLFAAGEIEGTLGTDLTGSVGGREGTLSRQGNDILLTVVPEPSTAMLLVAGALAALGLAAAGGIYRLRINPS